MNKIFISYRRDDSGGYSGRLADRLALTFGDQQIFRDFDDISPGQHFAESIQANLSGADVFLVVIGGGGDGPGGTAHMVAEVKKQHGQVIWLDTRTI